MIARQTAVQTAISMKGQRNEVVDIYNSYLPHPRGYKVKYEDQLCATYVSAVFIKLGWTDIVPPECGARQLYRNMEAIGCSDENVKRTPQKGDIIFFGQDSKPAGINHVGIVVELANNDKAIIYYDISSSGRVGRHQCPVGYSWICGYGLPNYAAHDLDKPEEPTPAPAPEPTPEPTPAPVTREFKVGDLVTINPGAKWYRGQSIKLSCISDKWYISSIKGDRAVLGMNVEETRNIQSPIHTCDITLVTPNEPVVEPADDKVTLTITVDKDTAQLLDIMAKGNHKTVGEIVDLLLEDAR